MADVHHGEAAARAATTGPGQAVTTRNANDK